MNKTVIANPEDIIIIQIDRKVNHFAYVTDIKPDHKRGWWIISFILLSPTTENNFQEISWILDDQQIRGEEFTMNNIPHQLIKFEPPRKNNSSDDMDADAPVSVPEKKPKPVLRLVKK